MSLRNEKLNIYSDLKKRYLNGGSNHIIFTAWKHSDTETEKSIYYNFTRFGDSSKELDSK